MVENLVERFGGRRVRHGLYRPFYIVQSVVTTVWALKRLGGLPDRTLYQVPKPWSWMWRAVQAFAVALLVRALAVVGYLRLLGVPPLVDFLRGREPEETPEAQGSPPDAQGQPTLTGPFRVIRHPDNLFLVSPDNMIAHITEGDSRHLEHGDTRLKDREYPARCRAIRHSRKGRHRALGHPYANLRDVSLKIMAADVVLPRHRAPRAPQVHAPLGETTHRPPPPR